MLIKCPKGFYHLEHNFRDAFKEEEFEEKYLEECFDNDSYIVGDIAAGLLRLKGFNNDPKSKSYYGFIEDYLEVSCVIGGPYYILKRITEDEYNKLISNEELSKTDESGFTITPLVKENFDKDSLVLKSTPKQKPRIEIDMKKINSMPEGKMPEDLKEEAKRERSEASQPSFNKPKPDEQTQTYVSSSNGFDPSKVQNRPKGFNQVNNKNSQGNNKNNQNKNNQNNNKNQNKNNHDNPQNHGHKKNKKREKGQNSQPKEA